MQTKMQMAKRIGVFSHLITPGKVTVNLDPLPSELALVTSTDPP